jgi:hypothetical protein
VVVIGYGIYLLKLPAYDEQWRPTVQIKAEYTMNEDKDKLELVGNEFFHDVAVSSDTFSQKYNLAINRQELPIAFKADWINLTGSETVVHGEKDTLNVDWLISSDQPWYRIALTVQADTLDIYNVYSDLNFNHKENKVSFHWYTEQTDSVLVRAKFTLEPGAKLIRNISMYHYNMPLEIDVSSRLANIRYLTTVKQTDTLHFALFD